MEKFIPVTRRALVSKLVETEGLLSWEERGLVERFAAAFDTHFSHRFYGILEEAKLLYDALDPDKDTLKTRKRTKSELLDNEYWLLQKVEKLLDKSNFFKIPQSQLYGLLKERDLGGLTVSIDLSDYETLKIWTRGKVEEKKSLFQRFRALVWKKLGYEPDYTDESYTRVFVAVRSKSSKKLHLKAFKEVPCDKLEFLLPDGKIKMSRFDKGFLATSVLVGASAVALRSLPVLADFKVEWTWVGMGLAGLIGAKAWIGYKNKRNHYLASLAMLLYYKTVANNRGVLTLLADRAQDEEFKEAILAYVFLLSPRNRRGVPGTSHTDLPPAYDTPESLRLRIEEWLAKVFNLKGIRFDIEDALEKLDSLGLLVENTDGTLTVPSIEDALAVLPSPSFHWQAVGALRDSENSDEQMTPEQSEPSEHRGWR